jgi:hypothetical protein
VTARATFISDAMSANQVARRPSGALMATMVSAGIMLGSPASFAAPRKVAYLSFPLTFR